MDAAAPGETDAGPTAPAVCEGVESPIGGDMTPGAGATVSGNAFAFSLSGGRIEGAFVTVVEQPTFCARTDADGYFEFQGVPVGSDVTLRMHHPDFPLIATGTHTVPEGGMERVTFQAPDHGTYGLLETITRTTASPELCQVAATVTEVGLSLYDPDAPSHGVAGAVVTLTPDPGDADGPIYFEWLRPGQIIPNRELTETTRDGGVLFLNTPPGDYVLAATLAGTEFTEVRIHCEAGLLVNPSPPWSIQQL